MPPFGVLDTAWFSLIGLLWTGYLFLEGFDFGVAMDTPFVIGDELDRRICLNAVGPTWDGNEVWLLTAGGATFAAFPLWYARLFNGFYLALFVVLIALILRGVSFEYRDKDPRPAWRHGWDIANFGGSFVAVLIWGVAFTNLAHGVRLSPDGVYTGGLVGLLHPIALLGGLASLAVLSLHGSTFLALKTGGQLGARAHRLAGVTSVAAAVLLAGTVAWVAAAGRPTVDGQLSGIIPLVLGVLSVLAVVAAGVFVRLHRDGWAFACTGAVVLLAMGAVWSRMFPSVLPASNIAANGITISQAASQHRTLVVMTVVAACFTPIVLGYQAWTYWVFHQRLIRPAAQSVTEP